MVRTQIQLTETQAAALKRRAARDGVSMAEAIRRSVDRTLAEAEPALKMGVRQRAIAAIGCGQSGLHDISERHDDYFAEEILG
jgi:hypothetical protein